MAGLLKRDRHEAHRDSAVGQQYPLRHVMQIEPGGNAA